MSKELKPLNFKTPGREFYTWLKEQFMEEFVDSGGGIFVVRLPFTLRDGEKSRAYVFQQDGHKKYTVSDGGGILNDLRETLAVKSDDKRPILHLKMESLQALGALYGFQLMENGCFIATPKMRTRDAILNLHQFWIAADGIARMWNTSSASMARMVASIPKGKKQ